MAQAETANRETQEFWFRRQQQAHQQQMMAIREWQKWKRLADEGLVRATSATSDARK
jgi:hypothetical protein